MGQPRIIFVENIRHDPVAGLLRGVAIQRDATGRVTRLSLRTSVNRPDLSHAEAVARLADAAEGLQINEARS